MSTCKECIHYDLCADFNLTARADYKRSMQIVEDNGEPERCGFFKDRSKFIELPSNLKKGDKLYYICEDSIFGGNSKLYVGEYPDIVTAVMAEGFFVSTRTDSDGTFKPEQDQFYYWNAIGDEYYLTREEAEQALKEREKE